MNILIWFLGLIAGVLIASSYFRKEIENREMESMMMMNKLLDTICHNLTEIEIEASEQKSTENEKNSAKQKDFAKEEKN